MGTSMIATAARVRSRPARKGWRTLAAQVGLIVASVWMAFRLLIDAWSSLEAAIVVGSLRLAGWHAAHRYGDQILVDRSGGRSFVANIGPLCSSLGLVLAFAAVAIVGDRGNARQRRRAFFMAAGIVVVCNLLRMTVTVAVGIGHGPAALESFHDGAATMFAVAFILVSSAVFVWSLPMFRLRPTDRAPAVRTRRLRRPAPR
jgi:exosortase/archaeosortase family protein